MDLFPGSGHMLAPKHLLLFKAAFAEKHEAVAALKQWQEHLGMTNWKILLLIPDILLFVAHFCF